MKYIKILLIGVSIAMSICVAATGIYEKNLPVAMLGTYSFLVEIVLATIVWRK